MKTKERRLTQVGVSIANTSEGEAKKIEYEGIECNKIREERRLEAEKELREKRRLEAEKELRERQKKYLFYDKLHTIALRVVTVVFFCEVCLLVLVILMTYFNILSENFLKNFFITCGAILVLTIFNLFFVVGIKDNYDSSQGFPPGPFF